MPVCVDEAGEHVLARGVDLYVTRRPARIAACDSDGIERDDVGDRVPFEDDVGGSARGCAVTVDDRRIADHEPRGAHAVRNALGLSGEGRNGRRDCGGRAEKSGEDHRAAPVLSIWVLREPKHYYSGSLSAI